MSKSNMSLEYRKRVDAHLRKSFDGKPPPALLNIINDEWVAAIKSAVSPGDDVADAADGIIDSSVGDWLMECGYRAIGSIWVHAERHEAVVAAEAEAKRKKAEADIAPLKALIRAAVSEALAEAGVGGGGVESDLRKIVGGAT